MKVNLDQIISKLTGWDLQLTIGGKEINIAEPSTAFLASAKQILGNGARPADIVKELRMLLETVVDKSQSDVSAWDAGILIGALRAVYNHSKQTVLKNFSGLVLAVDEAMGIASSVTAPAAKPAAVTAAKAPLSTASSPPAPAATMDSTHGDSTVSQ